MASVLITSEIYDLLRTVGAAALDGVRSVNPEWPDEKVVLSVDEPPAGEVCESVNVWLELLNPIIDPAECSLIWDAEIHVRLDICGGFENPNLPLRDAPERMALTEVFLNTFWAMMAGLTRAWREDRLPGGAAQCRRVTWGPTRDHADEGGTLMATAVLNVEVSPRYEESGS